jgi:SAM-dependent methyltransferase
MKTFHLRRAWLPLCAWLVAAAASAQTQTAPFEPRVGQPGKDVVWVPTSDALVDKMLDLAHVTAQDYVIDLGSGDGRTVIAAAKRGAKALGIEYNPDMVELSKKNAQIAQVSDKATFMKADLFESDFSNATVITMFLLPSINMQLRPKILGLKPGTRVVSNTFTMEDWQPDETVSIDDCQNWCTALFWLVPAKVDGAWRSPQGTLTLAQTFQEFTGALGDTAITNGKLRGDQISFTAGAAQFSGRVNGNVIEGTMTTGGKAASWGANR